MENNKLIILITRMLKESRLRRRKRNKFILLLLQMEAKRKNRISALLLQMMMTPRNLSVQRPRRNERNSGWFYTLWNVYSSKRFKQTVRVSKETFNYILSHMTR